MIDRKLFLKNKFILSSTQNPKHNIYKKKKKLIKNDIKCTRNDPIYYKIYCKAYFGF